MRVKCLAQEHNSVSPARSQTQTARSGDERTNHKATVPPISLSWRQFEKMETIAIRQDADKLLCIKNLALTFGLMYFALDGFL